MIKKCGEHANGKTCTLVIAEGKCLKGQCRLFKKVLNILPKLKKLYELHAQGVITHTIWRFDEKGEKTRLRKKKQAEKWLKELYPRIEKELGL